MAESFWTYFAQAATAVAQLFAMAGVGILLTRWEIVVPTSRKFLSELAFKVLIPSLLFTNILKCPAKVEAEDRCESLLEMLASAWFFFVLPFLWVTIGGCFGWLTTVIARTPSSIRGTAIAACAFGNATAVPLVLLAALAPAKLEHGHKHTHHLDTAAMRLRTFLSYLSVYLTTYQMLLWSVGNWLLSSPAARDERFLESFGDQSPTQTFHSFCSSLALDPVLALGPASADNYNFSRTTSREAREPHLSPIADGGTSNGDLIMELSGGGGGASRGKCWTRCMRLVGAVRNFLVPPVVGILLGLLIGINDDIRGILVHMPKHGDAPLQWAFDAILRFGGAAVPAVMIVLGSSLSSMPPLASMHWPTIVGVAATRLLLVPSIAYGLCWLAVEDKIQLELFNDWEHGQAAVVVAVIVSCAPTANNIVVMAELWGGPATKSTLAAMIFVQYCLAPVTLCCWIIAIMGLLNRPDDT